MQTKTLDRFITITPGIVGDKPHLAGHRITVQNIAIWHERLGWDLDKITTEYALELAEVHAALAYYYDHRTEIDAAIEEDRVFVDQMRQQNLPSMVSTG